MLKCKMRDWLVLRGPWSNSLEKRVLEVLVGTHEDSIGILGGR